jgi:hypothetical protein
MLSQNVPFWTAVIRSDRIRELLFEAVIPVVNLIKIVVIEAHS